MTTELIKRIESATTFAELELLLTAAGWMQEDTKFDDHRSLSLAVEAQRNALSAPRRLRIENGAKPKFSSDDFIVWLPATLWDAHELADLQVVLRLNTPKLRLLTLVCPRNHMACVVYQTILGPVAVYTVRSIADETMTGRRLPSEGGEEVPSLDWWHPRTRLAVVMDEEFGEARFRPHCRCRSNAASIRQLRELLAAGTRRAVLDE